MKQRTKEWIGKAEGDWKIAQREAKTTDPVWDGVCFHAQQCVEKYLKAFLEENNISFPKTHDLVSLLNLSGKLLQDLDSLRRQLTNLSTFGIVARSPGEEADREAAEEAMRTGEEARSVIRDRLGLS